MKHMLNILGHIYLTLRAEVTYTSGEAGDNQIDHTIAHLICALLLIGRKGAAGAAIAVVDGLFVFLLASRAWSAKY